MVNLMNATLKSTAKKFTPKQKQAFPLLVSGMSGKNVASAINCNTATVSGWLNHDEKFMDALNAFSEGSLRLAQVQMESLALEAINELRGLVKSAKSEQVRLKAIELVLSSVGLAGGTIQGGKKGQKSVEDLPLTNVGQFDVNKLFESLSGV